jgi:LruC domain-containing protein
LATPNYTVTITDNSTTLASKNNQRTASRNANRSGNKSTTYCATTTLPDGTWTCLVTLEPGTHAYSIVVTSLTGIPSPPVVVTITQDTLTNLFPSTGFGTLAFEDLWPYKGDYDFNDVVVDYQFEIFYSATNHIDQVIGTFELRAVGAGYQNGFGFQLSGAINPANVTVSGYSITENYINLNPNGTEAGQSKPTIIVFDNAFNEMQHPGGGAVGINTELAAPYVQPVTFEIVMQFAPNTYTSADLNIVGFNPFIIVNQDRGREVHLPGKPPTDLADMSLFGTGEDDSDPSANRFYMTSLNLPWALNIIERFDYPIEKTDITQAYLRFREWAESTGVLYPNWFQEIQGFRNQALIYKRN